MSLIAWIRRWLPELCLLALLGGLYSLRLGSVAVTSATEWQWLAELTGLIPSHFCKVDKALLSGIMALFPNQPLLMMRLAMVGLALTTLTLIYASLRLLLRWNRGTALLATLIPATSMGFYHLARTLNPQLPLLAGCLMIALAAASWWGHHPEGLRSTDWLKRLHPLSGWLGMLFGLAGYELGAPGLVVFALLGMALVWQKRGVSTIERLAFALGFVVATGVLMATLGAAPTVWPVLPAHTWGWHTALIAVWQGAGWLFPWGLVALAAWVELLTGAQRHSTYRAGHRITRQVSSVASMAVTGTAWLVGCGVLMLTGQTPVLAWLLLLWGPIAALPFYLNSNVRDQAHSLFKLSFDGTALCFCLLGIMLSWWLFFELPDSYPSTAWLMPGHPSFHIPLQDLLSSKLPDLQLPVWKYWFLPVPVLMLGGAAALALLQTSAYRGALSVGLMGWMSLWLSFSGLVVQPLLWPELTRNIVRYAPLHPGPIAQTHLSAQPHWRLVSQVSKVEQRNWCEAGPTSEWGALLLPEPMFYQCPVSLRNQWWIRRYVASPTWPDGALSTLMLVGGVPPRLQAMALQSPAQTSGLLLLTPLPLPTVETITNDSQQEPNNMPHVVSQQTR
jgi:hypothetical protein